uniref:Zgc:91849 n=1 Tax=Sphaeramia orbicularis TaxID=375764 RepID=A0A673AXG1_9TELE
MRVNTEVQAGPLYRVVGSLLSISCNVTDLPPVGARNEFEFRMKKPENPNFEINIISTGDEDFSFARYTSRVRNAEITLTHVGENSVVFEVQRLQKDDEGEYECSVVNPYTEYDGAYSAKTIVKVIDNSLSVSSSVSASLSHTEGDALTLTCQASSNTIQHTHLSFAWFLRKNTEDSGHPIILMDRDFTLKPGQEFQERYQAGLIRLDKIGEATYRLKMSQLEQSDQGEIYCEAQEWIQDPDRSWYSIAQRVAGETNLTVMAQAEVVPDMSSLVVRISVQQTTLQEGQQLSVTCSVDTQNLREKFFSVAWLREGVELAQIGPTGVLSAGPDYSAREQEGELRAARIGDRDYRLILQPVRTKDQGEYICRAWSQDRGQNGVFTQGAAQDSSPQLVSISATENGLSVQIQNGVTAFKEGDRLELTCEVDGVNDQLSVTWQHRSTSTLKSVFTSVISLSQEGVMEKSEGFINRKVKALRPAHDTFTLELADLTPSDSGDYQCTVSEWKTNSKTNSASGSTSVIVKPVDTFAKVILKSRTTIVKVGETVELICLIRQLSLPITLTWSLQRDDSTVNNILTVYSNGTISWSGEQHRYQLKIQKKTNDDSYYLIINGASLKEAGRYQCEASVFLENIHKKLRPSNQLAVRVNNPESKLSLTSTPALTRNINTDVKMKCSVSSPTSTSSRYAVTWLLQQHGENKTIVSTDRDALVTFGQQVELNQMQRISMSRTQGPGFELTIRQARSSDKGLYTCEVVEWLQDPRGEWFDLPPTSKSTQLTIIEPANDLHLNKTTQHLNNFTIPCNITAQSSNESEFKVTWFRQMETDNEQRPIFTVYRNATLHYWFGDSDQLKFGHPLPNEFSLTVSKPIPENSGRYFCEVEEWIPSLSYGWRRVALERSGYLTTSVYKEGECNCLHILTGVVIIALVIMFLLVLKICWKKGTGGKKATQSLWAEQHALNAKPSVED